MGRWIAYAVVLLLLAVALVLGTQGGKHRRLAETPRVQAVPAPQEPPAAVPEAMVPVVPVASAPVSPAPADVPPPPATMAPVVPAAAPSGQRHGLTFAQPREGTLPADVAHLSCHGEPRVLDQPHQDSCNPYKGDMSCRTVLPVLCVRESGAAVPQGVDSGFYKGWVQGALGATEPVMGAILTSRAMASARCEAELGAGWRMAEFHDGGGGWGLQGQRGMGLGQPGLTRYWVVINDQRGNCWDSTP